MNFGFIQPNTVLQFKRYLKISDQFSISPAVKIKNIA
jgi:hypothetical protein